MKSGALGVLAVLGLLAGGVTILKSSLHLVSSASAQGLLTVGAVSAALATAIQSLQDAIAQASSETKGAGTSLQVNAQIVLQDLNKVLKDRMDQAVTSLDAQERRLAEDAEALTRQI